MTCGEFDSPALINTHQYAPYSSALATSASASSTSVWSDSASQTSDDSQSSALTSDSDSCESYCFSKPTTRVFQKTVHASHEHADAVPVGLRQNPRRSSSSSTTRNGCPPTLVRQTDRKVNFVDNLVDTSTQIVEAIWPTSSVFCRTDNGLNCVLPLRTFIQETLRRSRTSYSTLQVALYYLILIKPHIPEYDFTMEQLDDSHVSRALQCGRRMFLAALILASKYLQDRNYSARAWSKISGLATQEINENEMAFLLAVNWKLHITEEVYQRWTECVMKFPPPQPPSPGAAPSVHREFQYECEIFRSIIMKLTAELDNVDDIAPTTPHSSRPSDMVVVSPRSLLASHAERSVSSGYESSDATPTPKHFRAAPVMEPSPASVYTPGRLAPALGLLPTPRLTPQTPGFSTPAVSAASHLLGRSSAMGFAMNQASSVNAREGMDRWPVSNTSSPQAYFSARRSSLANSVSTVSSPESMVSDTSRTSRSSSISSTSSLASAPTSIKLDVQARCRYAKQCSERFSLRPTIISSVPEDYEVTCLSSSPEPYGASATKELSDMSLATPVANRDNEMDDNDAARALQELHDQERFLPVSRPAVPRTSSKRSRPKSMENPLQDSVRNILNTDASTQGPTWAGSLVRPSLGRTDSPSMQFAVRAASQGANKRVCCSTEAMQPYAMSALHPEMGGMGGPGMWAGILN